MSLEAIVRRPGIDQPVAVLALYGEVSSETASKMDESIDVLMQEFGRLVLDLTHTLFISSAGWRGLLERSHKGAQAQIRLAGMQPSVLDVFYLLGINYVVAAHETVGDATAAFTGETVGATSRRL